MIVSRTPFRVSFFGGGTDYPVWYRENGGAVLATTIDKYSYLTCRYLPPFFEHKSRILYSRVETVKSNDAIEHPAVRVALKYMKISEGVEIHHDADLPARTGLGSSSTFAVGLLHVLYALRQIMPTKTQLAREAIHLEQNILGENVGCQDQVLAAFGGLCRIDFFQAPNNHAADFSVTPIIVSQERLQMFKDYLLLFFTGFSRIASQIAKEQVDRMRDKHRELIRMRAMVDESESILTGRGDLADLGTLLDENWRLKRSLTSKISTPDIDGIYEVARGAGAIGGKLLGAGGGGFMLLFARPHLHSRIKERLSKLLFVPFQFEKGGSQIIFYQPDTVQDRAKFDEASPVLATINPGLRRST
ncbi:MAG: kinase [Chloroflexi bacterium]|nr:kinase [Chloroflexota bacterium]